ALEHIARQPDVVKDDGYAPKRQQPLEVDDMIARANTQQTGDVCRGTQPGAFQYTTAGRGGFVRIRRQAQKAEPDACLLVGGHVGTLALATDQEIIGGELVYGLAHRALTDLEAAGKLHLAGDGVAGLPLTLVQALEQQTLDLLVQG